MNILKRCLPDVLCILLFVAIAYAYFMPADMEGRILYQHDTSAGRGAGQEATEYYQQTGERTRWSNATFSGMPTYQTSPSYSSTDKLQTAVKAYHLWLPENVWYVFVYLLGFYILLFLHHHRSRTYMEGVGSGLSAANDSGYSAGIQGKIPMGTGGDGSLHSV